MYPETYRYTREHEWVLQEGETGTVGITDHAQAELGDIVFVDLPKVGAHLVQGKPFGSVESVKAVSDLYAPLSGEVLAVNTGLNDKPEALNSDPHGEAWLIRIRIDKPEEIASLLTASEYQTYLG